MWVYNDYFIASYLYMYGVHVKISISIKKFFYNIRSIGLRVTLDKFLM